MGLALCKLVLANSLNKSVNLLVPQWGKFVRLSLYVPAVVLSNVKYRIALQRLSQIN